MTTSVDRKLCVCGCGRLAKLGRNYRTGHKPQTLQGRIMAKVSVTDAGCWEFHGYRSPLGYGRIKAGGEARLVHRVLYEILVGPVPPDLDMDHLCRNPPCCNPDHLEPVTPWENKRRGMHPRMVAHRARTCLRGHSQAEHACRRKSTGQVIYCRACRRDDKAAS